MSKRILTGLLLAALLAASIPSAFAQARGAFSIVCNVTGAKVYLNEELAGYTKPTFSALLKPGPYRVRVVMEHYRVFETRINMTSNPLTLKVNLVAEGVVQQAGRFPLTISANVPGAQVFLNGSQVGVAPLSLQVARGNYSVRVAAPGYQDFVASVSVAGPTAVNAALQGRLYQLAVSCNVPGAQVYVNDQLAGPAPYTGSFAQGTYVVQASAPGYAEASATVNLNRNLAVNLVLQPSLVLVQVVIPEGFLESRDRDNRSQGPGRGEVRLFVDGQRYNTFNFSIAPGRHNLRISAGGVSLEADFDFRAGRSYVLEPVFGWSER
jgi:hypothetical protein